MDILIGALAAWGGLMLGWTLLGVVLLPLTRKKDIRLTVVLRSQGDAPRMEQYLKGLRWLRDMGLVWWEIAILADELSPEARSRALRLIEKETYSSVIFAEELLDWMDL